MKQRRFLVMFLLLFSAASVLAQQDVVEFSSTLPAGATLSIASADLDILWARVKALPAWKYYAMLPRGRALVASFQEQVKGLETVGLTSESLLRLFGNDFALCLFDYNIGSPEFSFILSTRGNREYFDEIFNSIQISAVVYGIQIAKESYKGLTIMSLSSNFHYCDAAKVYLLGNRKSAIKKCIDAQMDKTKSLAQTEPFKRLRGHVFANTDFVIFGQDCSRFKAAMPYDVHQILVSGRLTDRFDLKVSMEGASNSMFIRKVKETAIPGNMYPFLPFYCYYAKAVNMRYAADQDAWSLKNPVMHESRSGRNNAYFSDMTARFGGLFKTNAMMFCTPYQTSTNYCFVFELGNEMKEEELVGRIWPDKRAKKGGVNNRVFWYYDETGTEDTFNYMAKAGKFLLIGDALKVVAGGLDAQGGLNKLTDSDTFKVAYNNTPSPRNISYIFNSMRWANVSFLDTNYEFLEGLKKFTSFVTVTRMEAKDAGVVDLLIRDFPKVPGVQGKK